MEQSETRKRRGTTVVFDTEVRERIETFRLETGRTFSGAVNWLVKQQLDLNEPLTRTAESGLDRK